MGTVEFGHHGNMRCVGSQVPGSSPENMVVGGEQSTHIHMLSLYISVFSKSTVLPTFRGHVYRLYSVSCIWSAVSVNILHEKKQNVKKMACLIRTKRDRTERRWPHLLPDSFLPITWFPLPRSPEEEGRWLHHTSGPMVKDQFGLRLEWGCFIWENRVLEIQKSNLPLLC